MAAKKKALAKPKSSSRRAAKETKDEEVEVGIQSLLTGNMPKVRDLSYHLQTIAGLIDRARTAAAKVTEAKKKAKESGVDVSAIMEIMSMKRADPLEIATKYRQMAALMQEEGMPVQLSLYEIRYGSPEEQGAKLGWDAGINGRSPPIDLFPEGAPGHKEMMRRWNDSQAQIITGKADAEEG